MIEKRDHGGGLDAAIAQFGGSRETWLDLSTGINPVPYDLPAFSADAWTALPDENALQTLVDNARQFWNVPDTAEVLAAPGASALIAQLPRTRASGTASIEGPTYNEHAAAFRGAGWQITDQGQDARVVVHPNNPTGRLWTEGEAASPFTIIDESFCDVAPDHSLIHLAARRNTIVLKSFGKFWGLAGLRLGFAIGDSKIIAQLKDALGPWSVAGPALEIGAAALANQDWARATRTRLQEDADRLDQLMAQQGADIVGGTTLFRLYNVRDALALQTQLAKGQVWSRIFPYSDTWVRLGLPHPTRWDQLEAAL